MADLSEASFDLRPSFNDTIWPLIQIGANDGRDRFIWWKKYCKQLIFGLLLVVLFVLGVHFLLLSEEIKKVSKQQSAILDKLEQNVVVINSTIESKIENVISKTAQYLNIVMTFVGVVFFVGFITVILMVTVTIWIHLNIRANNGPAAAETIEPKQNNDVEVDNIGQQQILQVPLEAAVWWHYLSSPITKGNNFAVNGAGQRRAPSIPNIANDDSSTYTDDEAPNRAAAIPLPAPAIPTPAVIANGGGLNLLKQNHNEGKKSVDKRHKCAHCQYSSHRSDDLKRHMLIHTGQKPHECQQCGQRFRQSGHLSVHQRGHTGEKPFICQQCGQRFRMAHHLSNHQRGHTGEKPFICEQCGKRFRRSHHLSGHQCVHTGGRAFKCDHCDKSFSFRANLTRHLRAKHL